MRAYLNGGDWQIVDEFVEVESGKRSDRPALDKALTAARLRRLPLVVKQGGPSNALRRVSEPIIGCRG
jgi:DNA invertase Pin-like site-specific DNA recombinase